ncbi:MAG TPA: indole-3-glycerol phosphate synthase TrpC [Candidatus Dormibacteraeota bacterium]|nr:indole-3-glycerol phosphate synthase TrpC [Candidatus Dormibacteraeota bacterium]
MSAGQLDPILLRSGERAAALRAAGEGTLREAASRVSPPRGFAGALAGRDVTLIAEMKRRSPSAGEMRPDLDVVEMAVEFMRGGASAISVLTEPESFGGSLADLSWVVAASPLPVLRKDFVVDPIQILEARTGGADAVLLIVRALGRELLARCMRAAAELGMESLVEVHDEAEMEVAVLLGAKLIGINNRDLDRLTTDLATTERLAPLAPPDCLLVSESGIRGRRDLERLRSVGIAAVLVGEALMRALSPRAELTALLSSGGRELQ